MKKEIKADLTFYKRGYELVFENAQNLAKVAEQAAGISLYGSACSLNILAIEEVIKSVLLLTKYNYPIIAYSEFNKVFYNHQFKHEHLKGLAALYQIELERMTPLVNVYDQLATFVESAPGISNEAKAEFKKNTEIIADIKRWIDNSENRAIVLEKIFAWLDSANDDKNRGFYVNPVNDIWLAPQSFTKEKYLESKNYTDLFMDYYRNTHKMYDEVNVFSRNMESNR